MLETETLLPSDRGFTKFLSSSIPENPVEHSAPKTDKYFLEWYGGPKKEGGCGAAFFGIQQRYRNIHDHDCFKKVEMYNI